MKIAYEPHPVTPERKAELRAQGYRIIDVRFAPQMDLGDRDALEARAKALGVKFNARTKDETLRKRIADAE